MGIISIVYSYYFKGKVNLKKIQKSDSIKLKMARPAVQPA
jgi:hypothetical protein